MTEIVEGPALAALSCGKPAFLVVLLPGADQNAQTMLDHALNWAPSLPKAEFLAMQAPLARDGEEGADLEAIAAALDRRLDEALAKRRLPPSHLALVGFSQGATLALCVDLRRRDRIAAMVAFSGGLSAPEILGGDIVAKPPTLLICGEDDTIAPISLLLETKSVLAAEGVPVEALPRPGLGHAIDDEGVIAAGDFLTAHVVHEQSEHRDHRGGWETNPQDSSAEEKG